MVHSRQDENFGDCMNTYLLPTDHDFVERIARAIGRDRLFRDASDLMKISTGVGLDESADSEIFDREFELLWHDPSEVSVWNVEGYRADALAAIRKINLLLLTSL